ncbi:hypothetical protein [Vibrio mangrovi]|uniref:Uncharacterized protein n=1 Tax=Vibrio mangrovi TaxID=474394 RepID=A0A1Y6IRP4_9VIBR|nr:hypothetical protein [Vibrio mangrovi]MDW6004030.1 hypothetical protein [Vibrio mangrovi]SMR99172.1 hypothetical protein VIM7927_00395 [Vibrio mangrovi]
MKYSLSIHHLNGLCRLAIVLSISIFSLVSVASSSVSAGSTKTMQAGVFPCISTDGTYHSFKYPGITSGLPCNVDTQAVAKAKTLAQQQRYFDIYSWQTFIALFWPTEKAGHRLAPDLNRKGIPRWNYWKESYQVYLADGSQPKGWNTPYIPAGVCKNQSEVDMSRKLLYRTNKMNLTHHVTVANEVEQAFTYPLVDQSGNVVRYEVLMNYDEFNYLLNNQLYNIDGQVAFAKGGKSVSFPKGDNDGLITGAFELKLAWKVLTDNDPTERYYSFEAVVLEKDGNCREVDVGLVGMHISHKTQNNKQWIWSTFEQVDNVRTNGLDQVKLRNGKKAPLVPSFNDPSCPSCPVNQLASYNAKGRQMPTQTTRVIPIDKNTEELNRQVQKMLTKHHSVFQYYELVGTQWPTDESALPANPNQYNAPNDRALEQIDNKPGGNPFPVFLINTTMETYMQRGNQEAQLQIQGFPFNQTPSFGTESCMGCHYSAGIYVDVIEDGYGQKQPVAGPATSGDFSWLLQLKAQFQTTQP